MSLTIASLPVGGGTLALSPMPGRGGNYVADLADLLQFAPALVLSMTTAAELPADLPADLARKSITWLHLPIADFGVPQGPTADLWPAAAAQALTVLAGKGRVLVHCMGGCGRSGMAVLRLMILAGEDTEAALTRLRQQRPCAVETDAQFNWAKGG